MHPIMPLARLKIAPSDRLLAAAVDHFLAVGQKAIRERGAFFVALSGGSTPEAIYRRLSSSPWKEQLDWSCVHLFWGDERMVDPTSSESNYRMAMEAGLQKLAVPSTQIHRIAGEEEPEKAARDYELLCKRILPEGRLDLVMLGMGEDGHTASLFPGSPALQIEDRLVAANWIESLGCFRVTLTFQTISQSREIAIYVMGKKKATMIQAVLEPQQGQAAYPIQTVVSRSPSSPLWFLDEEAASLLDLSIHQLVVS